MASIIIFSTLWGIYLKEWKGARPFTKQLVVLMLAFLVGSTVIIGFGNKKSADADEKAKPQIESSTPVPVPAPPPILQTSNHVQ
jgi:L-rhamnose-H+ transport protein